jgi:F-type H+-transporting ATPase subunit delta
MRPVEGMSVLVTGGGSGIGEGIARHLCGLGALVTISGRRAAKVQAVAESIGPRCRFVVGDVTSAETLSESQLNDLKAALKSSLGRDVALSTRVDSSILGGLIVKVGSRMMDNSLKTKLQTLKIAMKGTA